MKQNKFTPLMFLSSLGAGGIAIIPFAFLQYTFPHGQGLVKISDLVATNLSAWQSLIFGSLEITMIFFTVVHLLLSIVLFSKLIGFVKGEGYREFIKDPLKNSAILAPFISIVMTMNVFIGPIRFFSPWMASNLQSLMLPALIFWSFLFVLLMRMEVKLLKTSFVEKFEIENISFSWLLHPFALGMLTVTGTGIAAMAVAPNIAHTAAFMSFVSGSMGLFLLLVKTITVFKKHFSSEGLAESHLMPSFLIVVPNITLYAISAFRIGHYLEKQHGFHLDSYFLLVMTVAFAFETWYLIFGLSLLSDYFKREYFKKKFYVSKWGLICPMVAYAVLGSFVYSVFIPSAILYYSVLLVLALVVIVYLDLAIRNLKCAGLIKSEIKCE
jgi:tellurite resistance protein TehA-like permease